MDDGSEDEFGPGEVSMLPPGHDAWAVGDEPVVVIDISGMSLSRASARSKSAAASRFISACVCAK
jgi:hypothetical protein